MLYIICDGRDDVGLGMMDNGDLVVIELSGDDALARELRRSRAFGR